MEIWRVNAQLTCVNDSICNITCSNGNSCENMVIYCYGKCNINCIQCTCNYDSNEFHVQLCIITQMRI